MKNRHCHVTKPQGGRDSLSGNCPGAAGTRGTSASFKQAGSHCQRTLNSSRCCASRTVAAATVRAIPRRNPWALPQPPTDVTALADKPPVAPKSREDVIQGYRGFFWPSGARVCCQAMIRCRASSGVVLLGSRRRISSSRGCSAGENRVNCISRAFRRCAAARDPRAAVGVEVFVLQLGEDFLGPFDHFARHAGQPGDVDAVALVGGTGHDLVQKDHLVLPFAHGHVQVLARPPATAISSVSS